MAPNTTRPLCTLVLPGTYSSPLVVGLAERLAEEICDVMSENEGRSVPTEVSVAPSVTYPRHCERSEAIHSAA